MNIMNSFKLKFPILLKNKDDLVVVAIKAKGNYTFLGIIIEDKIRKKNILTKYGTTTETFYFSNFEHYNGFLRLITGETVSNITKLKKINTR